MMTRRPQCVLGWLVCVLLCVAVGFENPALAEIPCAADNTCEAPLICDTSTSPALCHPPLCVPSLLSADCPEAWTCMAKPPEGSFGATACRPTPDDPEACAVATEGFCLPPFVAPCRESTDCGSALFECKIRDPNDYGRCDELPFECTSPDDTSCPQGSTCIGQEMQGDPECSGNFGDDTWTCTESPPVTLYECRPEYWHIRRAFYDDSGSSGPPPDEDTTTTNTDTTTANTDTTSGRRNSDDGGCQVSRPVGVERRGFGLWWGIAFGLGWVGLAARRMWNNRLGAP